MKEINGNTGITGIIGNPVEHTLSPVMHNAGFKALGLNAVYVPFLVFKENLKEAVGGMRALNTLGFNVTVPYKEAVIKYLDDTDPLAHKIGAVNTVVSNYGKLTGYNTDASGFIKALKGKFNILDKNILVLGAGGAGRALTYALMNGGAARVFVYDVELSKAEKITKLVVEKDELKDILGRVDMLVNATSIGMKESLPPVNTDYLGKGLFVYDIIYNRQTELLKAAKKKWLKTLDGREMLLYQGVDAFELWTGRKAPVEVMRKALFKALKRKFG